MTTTIPLFSWRRAVRGVAPWLACLALCAPPAQAGESLDRLAGLMAERLALMDDVAAYKWLHHGAIEDPPREAALLESLDRRAAARGMGKARRADARAFFEAQISAAKVRQRAHFAAWKKGTVLPPESAPDLAEEIRPQLDRIGTAMLDTLPRAWLELQGSTGRAELRSARRLAGLPPGREDPAVEAAFAPLCKRAGLTANKC